VPLAVDDALLLVAVPVTVVVVEPEAENVDPMGPVLMSEKVTELLASVASTV
jgi:hypothetical protein